MNGYCAGCGMFYAGIERFDFGGGFCEECQAELDRDDWRDDDDYDPWDEDFCEDSNYDACDGSEGAG